MRPGGPTELEAAHTPHLDQLACNGALGEIVPIRSGVTPGSGPAHLALFGYNPVTNQIGRGVLEAAGVGMPVSTTDIAMRGNFCTVGSDGRITDRRAGRISSQEAIPLVEQLSAVKIPGIDLELRHLREHRFVGVMRGEGLNPDIADTDPQQTGVPPLLAVARSEEAKPTAYIVNQWIDAARQTLQHQPDANMFTLRGFSSNPQLVSFTDNYSLNACSIAVYPMYRGLARLAGMHIVPLKGDRPSDQFATMTTERENYDFFFVHIKETDSRGEDGDFEGKVSVIEAVDSALPALLEGRPDVLVVTGDHSTPARMRSHSWHPVPLLIWAPGSVREDRSTTFGETACAAGGLGLLKAIDVLPLMLAHAGRLRKYGA